MKLVSKEYAFATLLALPAAEQDILAKKFVDGNTRIKADQGAQKETAKVIGKLACVLEMRLEDGKKVNAFPANKTLAEFFKDITGAKPQTHVLSLKNAYGAYVKTGFITEADYDCNSNNCLELAARVVDAVKGDMTHAAVQKVAEQLKERSAKEAQNLREILVSVKPTAKLTPEEAIENFEAITADGQLPVVLAVMPETVLKLSEDQQRSCYEAFITALQRFDTAIPEKIDAWSKEMDTRNLPVQLITQAAA